MIGLLGGTFDPVHYGHLRPAHEVYRQLKLESLRLVPTAAPPHRPAPIASAAQRLRMVELAIPEFAGSIADDREIRRSGISYTVPTLESLRAEIGNASLCVVIGSDAFAGLPTWHRWERLFELSHIVVVQRPGSPLAAAAAPSWATARMCRHAEEIADRAAGGVLFVTVTPQNISATRLRAAIARGETPSRNELPPAVWEYIRSHNLYRSAAA